MQNTGISPLSPQPPHLKIVSGGQTGADRAALDFALQNGISCGGWCPKGRKAEDGPIPVRYPLTETSTEEYSQRTELNVRDSAATVIFSISETLTGGSQDTASFVAKHQKPLLHLTKQSTSPAQELKEFIRTHNIRILNIAGPRASEEPEIAAFVSKVLADVLGYKQRE